MACFMKCILSSPGPYEGAIFYQGNDSSVFCFNMSLVQWFFNNILPYVTYQENTMEKSLYLLMLCIIVESPADAQGYEPRQEIL